MRTAEGILREVFTENFHDSEDMIIKAMKIYANEKLRMAAESSFTNVDGVTVNQYSILQHLDEL